MMEMWTGIRHPAVIRVLGYSFVPSLFTSERGPVVITELMDRETLEDILGSSRRGRTREFWTGTVQTKFVFGIASALAAFHAEGIVYGGLTTGKVFVGDDLEPIVGLSECSGFVGDKRVHRRDGPNFFVAPEILEDSNCDGTNDPQSDVYSYGILLYSMFSPTAGLRFSLNNTIATESNLKSWVIRGERYAELPNIPRSYWNLIQRCWTRSAAERPRMVDIVAELLNHAEFAFPGTDAAELVAYQDKLGHSGPWE
jgi:serine/threonine protein kinase